MSPIEVLWTPDWNKNLFQCIKDAKKEVFLVSPWLKSKGAELILNALAKNINKPKVKLLTTLNEPELVGETPPSDLEAYRSLLEQEVEVKVFQNLHAKIYVCDDHDIITSSGNLTAPGLGLDGYYNFEIALHIHNSSVAQEILKKIQEVWEKKSRKLTAELLQEIEDRIQEHKRATNTDCAQNSQGTNGETLPKLKKHGSRWSATSSNKSPGNQPINPSLDTTKSRNLMGTKPNLQEPHRTYGSPPKQFLPQEIFEYAPLIGQVKPFKNSIPVYVIRNKKIESPGSRPYYSYLGIYQSYLPKELLCQYMTQYGKDFPLETLSEKKILIFSESEEKYVYWVKYLEAELVDTELGTKHEATFYKPTLNVTARGSKILAAYPTCFNPSGVDRVEEQGYILKGQVLKLKGGKLEEVEVWQPVPYPEEGIPESQAIEEFLNKEIERYNPQLHLCIDYIKWLEIGSFKFSQKFPHGIFTEQSKIFYENNMRNLYLAKLKHPNPYHLNEVKVIKEPEVGLLEKLIAVEKSVYGQEIQKNFILKNGKDLNIFRVFSSDSWAISHKPEFNKGKISGETYLSYCAFRECKKEGVVIWQERNQQETVSSSEPTKSQEETSGISRNESSPVLSQENSSVSQSYDSLISPLNQSAILFKTSTNEFDTVTVNAQGEEIKRERRQVQVFIENLGKDVELEMVSIPGGSFVMGSSEGDETERPKHRVNVPSFFIGKYPVTQQQYKAVTGNSPSRFKGPKRPVEGVSWNDATEFCRRLSQKTGKNYRLPSEAEWEYACRAGTTAPFYFGLTITIDLANYKPNYLTGRDTYALTSKGVYRRKTTDVGSFLPNAFGLYDMHGNVWEWCQDVWHNNYYRAPTDGSAWESGGDSSYRVRRGGSWDNVSNNCRCAIRFSKINAEKRLNHCGFRVALLPGL